MAVDIGQQHQQIRAHHGGDARGKPVVVPMADSLKFATVSFSLITGTLRHSRSRSMVERALEIAAVFLGVGQRHQHLAGGECVRAERFRPMPRQRDLSDGGGGLAVLELEGAGGQFQHRAAERDGAGGHHDDVALVPVQPGDVSGDGGVKKPCLSLPADESTSSEEPTLTTMRRKSLSDGIWDMDPAAVLNAPVM